MNIKAGDLVMVVRGRTCCGYGYGIGKVGVVQKLEVKETLCDACGDQAEYFAAWMGDVDEGSGMRRWCEISRLIRIDPPAEPVSVFDRVEEPA